MYGLIAGTGFDRLFQVEEKKTVSTPYGQALIYRLKIEGKDIIYLPRHGLDHDLAPHKINYRANCWALKELGVHHLISLCAVGSLKEAYAPGDLVLVRDIIDFTKNRISTYFDGDLNPLRHLDVSQVYNQEINQVLKDLGERHKVSLKEGVYLATEGPRFETPSEVKFYAAIGGDLMGMTGAPEVFLANELSMTYNALAYVTNYGTGISQENVELSASFPQVLPLVSSLLGDLLKENQSFPIKTKFV